MNRIPVQLYISDRSSRRNHHRQANRRGFSMMLVLISLGMATVLTTAYVTSHDTSATIGENVVSAAAAHWNAASGLELGIAVLETETDWRTAHTNGKLLDNYSFGGGTLNVLVEDIETGAPPTNSTSAVRITCIATYNGLTQVSSAVAHVEPSSETGGIDVDLSEFAVFVNSSVNLKDDATITRWPSAPKSILGGRLAIGTRRNALDMIKLENRAAAVDTTIYYLSAGASASMINNAGTAPLKTQGMLDNIPLPEAPSVPVAASLLPIYPDYALKVAGTISADKRYNKFEVTDAAGRLQLNGDITIVVENSFDIKSDAGITINGNVTIVAFQDFRMENNSFIELMPGASLKVYAMKNVGFDDAYVGEVRANRSVRDSTGQEPYMDPARIQFFGGSLNQGWTTEDISVLKCNIYAPKASLLLNDNSAIYGRVATSFLTVQKQAAIFYDPALDSGGGYTDTKSTIYDGGGRIKAGVTTLANLNNSSLQSLSDALNAPIKTLFGMLNPAGGGSPAPVAEGPTDPTPRTITVGVSCKQEGQDYRQWESNLDGAVVLVQTEVNNKTVVNAQSPGAISMTP